MDFCFYLITDRKQVTSGLSLEEVVARAVEAGVRGVLLREKDLPDRELIELAGRVRDLTQRYRARLLISGRTDVALAVGADGVHVSGTSLPIAAARELLGVEKYIGVSTHSLLEAKEAEDAGADFITFGPVYHTPSKAIYGPPAGVDVLREVCDAIRIPVFALGGVKSENAVEALGAGAYGVAVISAVIAAGDPGGATRELVETLRAYKLRKCI